MPCMPGAGTCALLNVRSTAYDAALVQFAGLQNFYVAFVHTGTSSNSIALQPAADQANGVLLVMSVECPDGCHNLKLLLLASSNTMMIP